MLDGNFPALDINSFMFVLVALLFLASLFTFISGISSIRESRRLRYYRLRRSRLVAGWRTLFIALGLFGAIYDFNKMSWFFRKTMSGLKPQLEAAGYHETAPDVYDTRNIPSIQQWARELTQRVRE